MERTKTARNVAIVLLIAAAWYALPGRGRAESTFYAVLLVGFGFGLGYLAVRLYREHRIALHSLGDRYRALFYGALAVGVVAIVGRTRMWQTGLGELVWFALIAMVVYALVAVYRYSRTY